MTTTLVHVSSSPELEAELWADAVALAKGVAKPGMEDALVELLYDRADPKKGTKKGRFFADVMPEVMAAINILAKR